MLVMQKVDSRVSFDKWVKSHQKEAGAVKSRYVRSSKMWKRQVEVCTFILHYHSIKETYDGPRVVGAMEGVDLLTGKNTYTPAPNSQRHDGMYKLVESNDGCVRSTQWVIDLFDNAPKEK